MQFRQDLLPGEINELQHLTGFPNSMGVNIVMLFEVLSGFIKQTNESLPYQIPFSIFPEYRRI